MSNENENRRIDGAATGAAEGGVAPAVRARLEVGRGWLEAGQLASLQAGCLVELDTPLHQPVELYAGSRLIARGELIEFEGNYALRVDALSETRA